MNGKPYFYHAACLSVCLSVFLKVSLSLSPSFCFSLSLGHCFLIHTQTKFFPPIDVIYIWYKHRGKPFYLFSSPLTYFKIRPVSLEFCLSYAGKQFYDSLVKTFTRSCYRDKQNHMPVKKVGSVFLSFVITFEDAKIFKEKKETVLNPLAICVYNQDLRSRVGADFFHVPFFSLTNSPIPIQGSPPQPTSEQIIFLYSFAILTPNPSPYNTIQHHHTTPASLHCTAMNFVLTHKTCLLPIHFGTKPGHFETSKIHSPKSKGVSEVSERTSE